MLEGKGDGSLLDIGKGCEVGGFETAACGFGKGNFFKVFDFCSLKVLYQWLIREFQYT